MVRGPIQLCVRVISLVPRLSAGDEWLISLHGRIVNYKDSYYDP